MSRADHRNLKAWQMARQLVTEIYAWTAVLPDEERFGLVSQMRRAAVSIPSNLAEGASRGTAKEFRRFALMARGSLAELQTQIILCDDLHLAKPPPSLEDLVEQLFRTISGLARHLVMKD